MDKVLANIRCTGKEERLEDCTAEKTKRTPGHEVCSSAKSVAGVICDTRKCVAQIYEMRQSVMTNKCSFNNINIIDA